MSDPVQKITFAEMRAAGVRGVLIYCSDYRCSHSICLDADRWATRTSLEVTTELSVAARGQRYSPVVPGLDINSSR
jgi:hypothetical protein